MIATGPAVSFERLLGQHGTACDVRRATCGVLGEFIQDQIGAVQRKLAQKSKFGLR